jgi:hypothetical protein
MVYPTVLPEDQEDLYPTIQLQPSNKLDESPRVAAEISRKIFCDIFFRTI